MSWEWTLTHFLEITVRLSSGEPCPHYPPNVHAFREACLHAWLEKWACDPVQANQSAEFMSLKEKHELQVAWEETWSLFPWTWDAGNDHL